MHFKKKFHQSDCWWQQSPLEWASTVKASIARFILVHPKPVRPTSRKLGVQEEMGNKVLHSSYTRACLKHYVKLNECRGKTLLCNFDGTSVSPRPIHMCCDNCASDCKCGAEDCGQLTNFPGVSEVENKCSRSRTRQGTREQKLLFVNI